MSALGIEVKAFGAMPGNCRVAGSNGYDKVNRKKPEARPMGQTISYQYDPNGNLTQRLSPNGAKRTFRYDDDNRLELEQHFLPKTTAPNKTMSYTYDQRGLLKSYSDGLTSGVYIYDAKGQKTSEAITFGTGPSAFTKTITRTYEANGLAKSMTYPGSTGTLNYTYDTNNQLKTYKIPGLAANNDTLTYQYRWNAIKEITMPANLKRVVTLDALQRPERIEVKGYGATPGNNGEPVMDHRYIYDEVSNISKKTTLDGDYVYGYDRLDRLTDAAPPAGLQQSASNTTGLPIERYSYDNVHNRLTSLHQPGPWIYNENNELKAWGSGASKHAITYDLNGSTIKDEVGAPVVSKTTEYIYDAQDRMVEVKDNSVTVAKYAYDPMGRRIWRQAGAEVTWFLYSDEGLIGEYSISGLSIVEYGAKSHRSKISMVWQRKENLTYIIHSEKSNFPAGVTSSIDGRLEWNGIHQSFGHSNSGQQYKLRFPGQWRDATIGLYDNWYRIYDPSTGRYNSADPNGFNGLGKYYYASNNPERINDFMGLCDDCEPNAEKYNNPTWTARLKLRAENPFAKHLKLELCGLICRVRDTAENEYFASENMIGTAGLCDPFTATCPSCSTSVAMWHIHVYVDADGDGANDYLSEEFSPQDFMAADAVGVDSYLATPANRFLHYVARSGWKPIDRGVL